MAYDEKLADRIREKFENLPRVKEKKLMGGWVVMLNDKMCVGIFKNQLMCRIDKEKQEELLERKGAELMEMNGRKMNGYIIVNNDRDFDFWISESIAFNKFAKSSKKPKSSKPSISSKKKK